MRALSTTRRHHRCRTRKDRPVSSRTATVSPIVRHSEGLGEISRLPTEHQTVLRSSRQSVPSLAFRRFLPSARELRAWIPPYFGLRPPAPSHEQRETERLCLEAPIYSASMSGGGHAKSAHIKKRVDTNLATLLPINGCGCAPLGKTFLMFRNLRPQLEKRPGADTSRPRFVGRSHTYNRSTWSDHREAAGSSKHSPGMVGRR